MNNYLKKAVNFFQQIFSGRCLNATRMGYLKIKYTVRQKNLKIKRNKYIYIYKYIHLMNLVESNLTSREKKREK